MHLKGWAVVLGLASLLNSYSAIAQASQHSQLPRDLLRLCTRSPYNSRCEGRQWPVLLTSRPGSEAGCRTLRGEFRRGGICKVQVEATQLTVYREIGEPIPELENQRDTTAITIPLDQIIAVGIRSWSVGGGGLLTGWGRDDRAVMTVNYLSNESPTDEADYRTNAWSIISAADDGFPLAEQLMQLSPSSRAEAIALQLSTPTGMPLTGAAAIAQLLDTQSCPRCDLRNAELSGANLSDANLEGANLEGANLTGTDLGEAYLTGANLNRANLTGADLRSARLPLTTLVEANLQDANISFADLQWADLRSANLVNIEAELTEMQEVNLSQADLSQADLEGVNLFRANLAGANLTEANLSDKAPETLPTGGLIGLALFGPTVIYRYVTDLSGANLQNANLTGANLEDVLFVNADLSNANFTDVDLGDTDLSRAILCGTTMPDGSQSAQGCP
ncbi:MAG TPA: pentapeptide repeat-containing protein [Chroococcidiopsis sp.]